MHGSAQPENVFPTAGSEDAVAGASPSNQTSAAAIGVVGDKFKGTRALEEEELGSALQLLVERAQYITGATGAALALPQGEEMVCRASAGSSAPAVGARLQVRSGLTGESISRKQLLRCNNAETDPRVNLETCRAVGIASIVVLPLLRSTGEVRGLFELFSDHPYAFEERDLIALERMAGLTSTALDLAEQRKDPAPRPRREPENTAELAPPKQASVISLPELPPPNVITTEPSVISSLSAQPSPELEVTPALVPEAMLRVQKCASCGFPVSEGRTLCLDCEKKDQEKKDFEKKQREKEHGQVEREESEQPELGDVSSGSATATQEEFVPAFLANASPVPESWMANHVNLLAIVVLVVGILVAVVVFR